MLYNNKVYADKKLITDFILAGEWLYLN